MNSAAGTNPEAGAITEVMFANADQAAQARPVTIGNGDVGCEINVASLVEGLGARGVERHASRFYRASPRKMSVIGIYQQLVRGPEIELETAVQIQLPGLSSEHEGCTRRGIVVTSQATDHERIATQGEAFPK